MTQHPSQPKPEGGALAQEAMLKARTAGTPVPHAVAASWRRSIEAGLDADTYRVPYHSDIDTRSRLAVCAEPVLRRLVEDLNDIPVAIALTDAKVRIIDRRDCSDGVTKHLDRVDFNPGFAFAETGVGTNGVGTALESGQAVSVVGRAHFNESLTPFACTGAPVRDPISGRVEGILDVSQLAESWSPLVLPLVRRAAIDIGALLLEDRDRLHRALFGAYTRAAARTHHAVIAVGASTVLNRQAQRMFDGQEQALIQHHARHLLAARGGASSDEITLPTGRRFRMRVSPVPDAIEAGAIVTIREVTDAQSAPAGRAIGAALSTTVRRSPRVQPPGDSPCPAMDLARRQLRDALSGGRNVLLIGESGTGRAHLVRSVVDADLPGTRLVVVDHDALEQQSEFITPASFTAPASEQAVTVLLIRHIDRVTERGRARLARLRFDWDAAGKLVLAGTVTDDRADAVYASLLAVFDTSIRVPALRHRPSDIGELADALLRELAGQRRVRISDDARRALAAHHWPGNVEQLRRTLQEALRRRVVGELEVDDLPGFCHSRSPRTLTALEVTERDAIVTALRECSGNRVQACRRLGISRSSLYRKIKTFGITDT